MIPKHIATSLHFLWCITRQCAPLESTPIWVCFPEHFFEEFNRLSIEKLTHRVVYRTPPGNARKYCKQQAYTANSLQKPRRVRFYTFSSQRKSDWKQSVSSCYGTAPSIDVAWRNVFYFFHTTRDFFLTPKIICAHCGEFWNSIKYRRENKAAYHQETAEVSFYIFPSSLFFHTYMEIYIFE